MAEQALAIPDGASKILRDKLRTLFIELIPEEKLDEAIKVEWDAFFDDNTAATMSWGWKAATETKNYKQVTVNDDRRHLSPFKRMVRSILLEIFEAALRDKLKEETDPFRYGNEDYAKGEVVTQVVKELGPELLDLAMRQLVENLVEKVRRVSDGDY
jgi:hypothetical protein